MGKEKPFYIEYLHLELDKRIYSNNQYSLRAFARDLEIDASLLSKILARKAILAVKKADLLAKKLNLPESDREKFVLSVAEEQKCTSLAKVDGDFTNCEHE